MFISNIIIKNYTYEKNKLYLIISIIFTVCFIAIFFNNNSKIRILEFFKNKNGLREYKYINYNNSVNRIIILYSDSTFLRKDDYYYFSDFYSGRFIKSGNKLEFKYNLNHMPKSELPFVELDENSFNINFIMSYGDNDYTVSRERFDPTVDTSIFNKKDTIPITFILQ